MGFFSMVVLIVLIGAITSVLSARYRAMERGHLARSDAGSEGGAARDEVRRLSERVAVLERVITDGRPGMDLDREIERLRDRPEPRGLADRREQA